MSWLADFMQEVMERRLEQSFEKGLREGRREAMQSGILIVLAGRFGRAADALADRIRSIDDDAVLDGLATEIAAAPSLEAFASKLPDSELP